MPSSQISLTCEFNKHQVKWALKCTKPDDTTQTFSGGTYSWWYWWTQSDCCCSYSYYCRNGFDYECEGDEYELPTGSSCTLTLEDYYARSWWTGWNWYGNGWNGAQWSAPGWTDSEYNLESCSGSTGSDSCQKKTFENDWYSNGATFYVGIRRTTVFVALVAA